MLEQFLDGMARRPCAGRTQAAAELAPHSREEALRCRYMQPHHPHLWSKLPLDLDNCTVEAALTFGKVCGFNFPVPNLETSRKNGNQQAYFHLRDYVGMSLAHRPKPRFYALSIFRRLKAAFDADPNSTGRVMRGILHPNQHTVTYHAHLYTLNELDELLPTWDNISRAATLPASARESRNYVMFRMLEAFAHDLRKQGVSPATGQFRAALEVQAAALLPTLPQKAHPYTLSEVRRTITSVIKRAQSNKTRPLFALIPRANLWSTSRPTLTREEARERQLAPLNAANRGREVSTAEFYLNAARRLVERGEPLTARNMAQETGRNLRKVKAHASIWRSIQPHQMADNPLANLPPDITTVPTPPAPSRGSGKPEKV